MSKLAVAKFRARLYAAIRAYFEEQGVLEVETPLLHDTGGIDAHIDLLTVGEEEEHRALYLQSSPELFMKRLLCRGYPSVFQIGKAFRSGEQGRLHRREFTMLEWYRLGYSQRALMEETAHICQLALGPCPVQHRTYQQAFLEFSGLDPVSAGREELMKLVNSLGPPPPEPLEKTDLLDFILSQKIQPGLPRGELVFIYNFPMEQACLARPALDNPAAACRFEAFYNGVELCNGFEELTDHEENKRRMDKENGRRKGRGKKMLPFDGGFVEDLMKGLPVCAGAAMGLDRLLLLTMGLKDLSEVLEF